MTPPPPQPGFWQSVKRTLARNPISFFAVFLVACTATFLGYMSLWQTSILTSPGWCSKSLGAAKATPGQEYQQALEALKSCNELLQIQLNAIAVDSHIDHGAIALVLIVLIVVVVAGARASWKLNLKDGSVEGSVARHGDVAEAAAAHVVEGAKEAEAEVKEGAP